MAHVRMRLTCRLFCDMNHDFTVCCVAECCRVLQCVAVFCSVLQCVAVCCSVLQCVAVCCWLTYRLFRDMNHDFCYCLPAKSCMYSAVKKRNNTPQHTATHCNTLQHSAAHIATHTATHYNILQHTEEFYRPSPAHIQGAYCCSVLQCVAVCCSVLQCVAVCCSVLHSVVCCSVLQCVAVCCSVLQCVAVCCSAWQSVCRVLYDKLPKYVV